jgi:hypothetical protein
MARRHIRDKPGDPDIEIDGDGVEGVMKVDDGHAAELPSALEPGYREVLRVAVNDEGVMLLRFRLKLPIQGGEAPPGVWGQLLYRVAHGLARAAGNGGATVDLGRGPMPVTKELVLGLIAEGFNEAYSADNPEDDDDDADAG